jgi:hypothetical protein
MVDQLDQKACRLADQGDECDKVELGRRLGSGRPGGQGGLLGLIAQVID